MFPDDGGVIPLPSLHPDGGTLRFPQVSNEFAFDHQGVDMAYDVEEGDPKYTGHYSAHRTPSYYMPDGVPVFAAGDGDVWLVGEDSHGKFVRLEHDGGKWNTYYRHLARVDVKKGDKVTAGQQIGVAGADPSEGELGFIHSHFELQDWRDGNGRYVDPEPYMRNWSVLSGRGDGVATAAHWGDWSTKQAAPRNTHDDAQVTETKSRDSGGGLIWLALIALLMMQDS